jgi:hypothetical protein
MPFWLMKRITCASLAKLWKKITGCIFHFFLPLWFRVFCNLLSAVGKLEDDRLSRRARTAASAHASQWLTIIHGELFGFCQDGIDIERIFTLQSAKR